MLGLKFMVPPEIFYDGKPLKFAARKALALFAYLGVESGAQPREKPFVDCCLSGLQVIAEGNSPWIDRTDRLDTSVFRLGLDWIKYASKHRLEFQPLETIIHVR